MPNFSTSSYGGLFLHGKNLTILTFPPHSSEIYLSRIRKAPPPHSFSDHNPLNSNFRITNQNTKSFMLHTLSTSAIMHLRTLTSSLHRYKRDLHQFTYCRVTVSALIVTAAYSPLQILPLALIILSVNCSGFKHLFSVWVLHYNISQFRHIFTISQNCEITCSSKTKSPNCQIQHILAIANGKKLEMKQIKLPFFGIPKVQKFTLLSPNHTLVESVLLCWLVRTLKCISFWKST